MTPDETSEVLGHADRDAAGGLDVAVDALVPALFDLEQRLATCCSLACRCGTELAAQARARRSLDDALVWVEHLCSAAKASLVGGGRLADHV